MSPIKPSNLSAVHQKKKPKENLGSLPSHGWIPDPEIFMCQKKKKTKEKKQKEKNYARAIKPNPKICGF
jgi:hypothetical protein